MCDSNLSLCGVLLRDTNKAIPWTHYLHSLLILLLRLLWVSAGSSPSHRDPKAGHDLCRSKDYHYVCNVSFVTETARPQTYVNVTTVITYLLPGSATTDTREMRPVVVRSILFLAVFVTVASWRPVTTDLAIALRSTSRGCWPSWAGDLFVGGRDNFGREVQPDRTHQYQTAQVLSYR